MKKRGFTLVEVLLTLFILSVSVLIFGQYSSLFYKMEDMEDVYQKITDLSVSKMEELKSGRIYIDGEAYLILEDGDGIIRFEEDGCTIEVHMRSIPRLPDIKQVTIRVNSNKKQYQYHLVRLIRFNKNELPRVYDEFL